MLTNQTLKSSPLSKNIDQVPPSQPPIVAPYLEEMRSYGPRFDGLRWLWREVAAEDAQAAIGCLRIVLDAKGNYRRYTAVGLSSGRLNPDSDVQRPSAGRRGGRGLDSCPALHLPATIVRQALWNTDI